MRYFTLAGILAVLFCAVSGAAAAEEGQKWTGTIAWEEKVETPAVQVTGSVLWIDDPSEKAPPAESYAAMFGIPGKRIDWTPTPDTGRSTGGAMLLDAALAPDGTALLFLERMGVGEGPFGCRILCFDLTGRKFTNALEFKDRCFVKLAVVPGSDRIVAMQMEQKIFRQKSSLVMLDGSSGKVVGESVGLPDKISDWAAAADRIWVKSGTERTLLGFSPSVIGAAPQVFQLREPGGKVVIADGTLVHAVGNRVDIFRVYPELMQYSGVVELPADFRTESVRPVSADASALVVNGEDGRALFVWNGKYVPLADRVSGEAVWCEAGKMLFLNIEHKDMIAAFRLPGELKPFSTMQPGQLRPATRGRVVRMFAMPGERTMVLVLDQRANVYTLTPSSSRRWQKDLLFKGEEKLR